MLLDIPVPLNFLISEVNIYRMTNMHYKLKFVNQMFRTQESELQRRSNGILL